MKILKRITLITAGISILYIALSRLLLFTDLSLRAWVDVLGKAIVVLILPILLIILLLAKMHRSECIHWGIKMACTAVALVVYGVCAMWGFLFIFFSVPEERRLFGNLLVTDIGGFPGESEFVYERSVAFFFKTSGEITDEEKVKYLEEKYDREFVVRRGGGRIYDREFPEVDVTVGLSGGKLDDDYENSMMLKYLMEGYRILRIERDYYVESFYFGRTGYMIVKIVDESDINAAAKDIYKLLSYVTEHTDFFEEHRSAIGYYCEMEGQKLQGTILFTGSENMEAFAFHPAKGEVAVEEKIRESFDKFQKAKAYTIGVGTDTEGDSHGDKQDYGNPEDSGNMDSHGNVEEYGNIESHGNAEAYGDTESYGNAESSRDMEDYGDGSSAEIADDEVWTDYREEAARIIYDAVLVQKGFSYEVYYNAKGNLYIDLGSKESDENDGKVYSYQLVYDRASKNGACELFVLYRSVDSDSSEAIVDMYAVETATGKVVASGRKAWSDVGTKEYRELTGE